MTLLFILPLIGAVCLYFYPSKKLALTISIITFLESVRLFIGLDKKSSEFQYIIKYVWDTKEIAFGIDGISINFILLTTILIPICIMVSWDSVRFLTRQFLISLLGIEWLLIAVFTVLDVLGFYVFYEGVLIPMFYIIGVW
jgi:NADH:ubiquinone oxidoreductase subunit 4 (subunit M)